MAVTHSRGNARRCSSRGVAVQAGPEGARGADARIDRCNSRSRNSISWSAISPPTRAASSPRRREAARAGASLVVTPELSLCGYPPEDLLLRPAFIDACAAELAALAGAVTRSTVLVGFPERAGSRATTPWRSCATAASRRSTARTACPTTRCSTRSAISSRATRHACSTSTACASASSSARTSGSRNPPRGRRPPARRCCWCQRLALPHAAAGAAPRAGRRAGARDGAADRLRQPRRRPGRAGVRRRVVRRRRRRRARAAGAGVARDGRARALRRRGAAARARRRSTRRSSRTSTTRWSWACATTSARTGFPACCSGCRAASIRR